MDRSRRRVLWGLPTAVLGGAAGCWGRSSGARYLLVSAINNTPGRHVLALTVEHDGERLVRQYLELAGGEPDASVAQTELSLRPLPSGTRLTVRARVDDGAESSAPLTLDCGPDDAGSAVTARITEPNVVSLSNDNAANNCYDGSGSFVEEAPD